MPAAVVLLASVLEAPLLARVAKSEDPSAGAAVMWTVLNRAREYRTSIFEEVTRPGQYQGIWTVQAKAWLDNPLDAAQLQALERTARQVLRGALPDPTGGATHFHRVGTADPPWAPEEAKRILVGKHWFYKEKKDGR